MQVPAADLVKHIAELTTTGEESVSKTLLFRTVATGGGEVIEKGHSQQEACFGRDAFVKVIQEVIMSSKWLYSYNMYKSQHDLQQKTN